MKYGLLIFSLVIGTIFGSVEFVHAEETNKKMTVPNDKTQGTYCENANRCYPYASASEPDGCPINEKCSGGNETNNSRKETTGKEKTK